MEVCPDVQAALTDFYQSCDPSFLREPMPHWDFLWSDMNTRGFQQAIVKSEAKKRTVVVTYDQRLLESEAEEINSCDQKCVATKKRGNLSTSYEIDPCDIVEWSELIDGKDFMNVCQGNQMIIAKKIQRGIDVVIRKLATRLVERSIPLLGGWSADVDGTVSSKFLQIKTKKDGSIDPMPNTWQDVKFALMQSEFCDVPSAVISGSTFYKYAQLMESGCCTSSGLDIGDIAQRYGQAVLYDKRVQKAIGADKSWVIQAGSLIPLWFTLNNNGVSEISAATLGLGQQGANYAKGVLADPATGFPLDVTISDDCGAVSLIIRGNADVKTLPNDMFAPGDDYEGVTGFAGIEVANA